MAVGTVSSVDSDVWQLIATNSPSAASSTSFSSISGYKKLMVVWQVTASTTGANNWLLVRLNSDSTSGNYGSIAALDGTNVNRSLSSFYVTAYTDTGGVTGYAIISDTDKTTPKFLEKVGSNDALITSGIYVGSSAVTALSLHTNTGTITGTVSLYGIAV